MKIQQKILNTVNLFFVLMFSAECMASTVNFEDPATITNGYTIQDYEIYKRTQLQIDFEGTAGISLNMNYSLISDEYFSFKLNNLSGETVSKLFFEFVKPEGGFFNSKPRDVQWEASLYDTVNQITVDRDNVDIFDADNSVGVEISFLENREWHANESVYFILDWNGFHTSRENWTLNIDLNERDLLDPVGDIVPAPIPGAIWLFGSALVGIFFSSSKKIVFKERR